MKFQSYFSLSVFLLTTYVALWLTGCVVEKGCDDNNPATKQALIVTADTQSGAYSTVTIDTLNVVKDIQSIHADSVCRYDPVTKVPYIVARWGAGAIDVIDPNDCWSVVKEYSVGADTNPYDIAVVSENKAYVTRFNHKELLIVHPTEGTHLGSVDLSAYADEDGVPEAAGAVYLNGKVYVEILRLFNLMSTDHSSLLVIDAESDVVEKEIRLTTTNPYGKLRYSKALDRIVLGETGQWGVLDGGVELFNPKDNSLSGLLLKEQDIGGDLNDVVVLSETKGYAIISVIENEIDMKTHLIAFNPSTGEKTAELIKGSGFDHAFIELSPDGTQLWVTERVPGESGIRIFDTTNDLEITKENINVGLPPNMICFVP